MTTEEVQDTASTAIQLMGNASVRISRLRREWLISSVNKALLPLAKDDKGFTEAPPLLFGPNFAKRSKEFLDQVKAIKQPSLPKAKNSQGNHFLRASTFEEGRRIQIQERGTPTAPVEAEAAKDRATPSNCYLAREGRVTTTPSYCSKSCTCIKPVGSVYTRHHCPHGHNTSQCRENETTSWTAGSLPENLGVVDKGPLGPRNYGRAPYNIRVRTNTITQTTPSIQSESEYTNPGGSRRTSGERGSNRSTTTAGGRFLLHHIPGPKEGRRSETSHQSESAK